MSDPISPPPPEPSGFKTLASRPLVREPRRNGGFPPWKMAVLIRCKAEELHRMYWHDRYSMYRIARILKVGEPTVKRALDWLDRFGSEIAKTGSFDAFEKELFKKHPHYKDEDFYKEYVIGGTWPPQKKRGPKPGSRRKRGADREDGETPQGDAGPAPAVASPAGKPSAPAPAPNIEPRQSVAPAAAPKQPVPDSVAAAMARYDKPQNL